MRSRRWEVYLWIALSVAAIATGNHDNAVLKLVLCGFFGVLMEAGKDLDVRFLLWFGATLPLSLVGV